MRRDSHIAGLPDGLQTTARKLASDGTLKRLRDEFTDCGDPSRYRQLEVLVLEACKGAIEFRDRYRRGTEPDYYTAGRRKAADFAAELKVFHNTARRMVRLARDYRDFVRPDPIYLLKHGVELSGRKGTSRQRLPLVVIEAYQVALQKLMRTPRKHRPGPISHQFQVGPLYFEEGIDSAAASQILMPETGLLFQLTSFFRRFTSGDEIGSLQCFEKPMPARGKPCWPLSAALINASLDTGHGPEVLARRLHKLILKHEDVCFAGWHDEALWQDPDPLPDLSELLLQK